MSDYLNSKIDINSDKVIEFLDEMPFWSAPFGLKLLDKIEFRKNISILDIGSGTGFPLIEVAMRMGDTCKITGLDPWEKGINRIHKKLVAYNINNVELITGKAENIPLKNDSTDLIISNNGINNVLNPEIALKECARVLKNGGQFILTVNLEKTMYEFYDIFKEVLYNNGMEPEIESLEQHIYHKRKPLNELSSLLIKSGFNIDDIESHKFEYRFNDGTSMLNHYFIKLAFLESWMEILYPKERKKVFQQIEKEINRKSEIEGSFKLTIPFVVIKCSKP